MQRSIHWFLKNYLKWNLEPGGLTRWGRTFLNWSPTMFLPNLKMCYNSFPFLFSLFWISSGQPLEGLARFLSILSLTHLFTKDIFFKANYKDWQCNLARFRFITVILGLTFRPNILATLLSLTLIYVYQFSDGFILLLFQWPCPILYCELLY